MYQREIEELRILKEQLHMEINIQPITVSAAIKDMMKFMEENRESDKVLVGFENKKENPYEDKEGCVVM